MERMKFCTGVVSVSEAQLRWPWQSWEAVPGQWWPHGEDVQLPKDLLPKTICTEQQDLLCPCNLGHFWDFCSELGTLGAQLEEMQRRKFRGNLDK